MRLKRIGLRRACAAGAVALSASAVPAAAAASETIQYKYDARGRLIEVERAQPAATAKTTYTYDRAGNRTKKEVITTP